MNRLIIGGPKIRANFLLLGLWFAAECRETEAASMVNHDSDRPSQSHSKKSLSLPSESSAETGENSNEKNSNEESSSESNTNPPSVEPPSMNDSSGGGEGSDGSEESDSATETAGEPSEDETSSESSGEEDSNESNEIAGTETTSETTSESSDEDSETTGDSTLTMADVQRIFERNCGCHNQQVNTPGDLLLREGEAYDAMVGVKSSSELNQVEPGMPDSSYLVHKLAGTHKEISGGNGKKCQLMEMASLSR